MGWSMDRCGFTWRQIMFAGIQKAASLAAILLCLSQSSVSLGLSPPLTGAAGDRLEPGLQGQTMPADNPGSILAQPYSKGVRVIGHDPISGRDSNVQLSWVDHCAYV